MSNHNILEELAICVCEVFGITKKELLTTDFGQNVVDARSVFVYTSIIYADKYTLERIGVWMNYDYDRVYKYLIRCRDLLTINRKFRERLVKTEFKYINRDFAPYNYVN